MVWMPGLAADRALPGDTSQAAPQLPELLELSPKAAMSDRTPGWKLSVPGVRVPMAGALA